MSFATQPGLLSIILIGCSNKLGGWKESSAFPRNDIITWIPTLQVPEEGLTSIANSSHHIDLTSTE